MFVVRVYTALDVRDPESPSKESQVLNSDISKFNPKITFQMKMLYRVDIYKTV